MNEEERDEYDNPLKGGAGPDRARSHSYDDSQFPPGAATDKSTASSPQPSEDGDSSRHPVQRRGHSGVVSGAGAVGLSTLTSTLSSKLFGEADFDEGSDETPAKDHELRRHGCGLLHPDTGVRQLYDLLQMSILLWFLFILPYRLGFVIEPKGWEIAFDIVIDCILGVDILLNFHMYYHHSVTGILVTNKAKIRKSYIKAWFVVDFFTVCPFDQMFRLISLIATNESTKARLAGIANEVRVLKMARLVKLGRLKELIDPQRLSTTLAAALAPLGIHGVELAAMFYMRVTVLVFILISCAHVMACWWIRTGVDGLANNGTGWIADAFKHNLLTDSSTEDDGSTAKANQYSSAMYFVFATISSTGYGDIAATTHKEERVADIIIIFGVFMLAYIVGTFGMMISNIAGDSNRFDGKMRNILALMQQVNAPVELKLRVHEFYTAKADALLRNERDIYEELPGALRRDLIKARYKPILTQIPFMRGMSDTILVKICATVKEYCIMPGDIICRRGDERQDLILITRGIVIIMDSKESTIYEAGMEADEHGEKVGSRQWRMRKQLEREAERAAGGVHMDTHGRRPDVIGEEREDGSYFGVDEFLGLSDSCSVTLKARIYCECSVLDRTDPVLQTILGQEKYLRHRLETYAMAQREIELIMEDGEVEDKEVDRLQQKLQKAMDERPEFCQEPGEVALENVLAKLQMDTEIGDNSEHRQLQALQGQVNNLEEKMDEVLLLLRSGAGTRGSKLT